VKKLWVLALCISLGGCDGDSNVSAGNGAADQGVRDRGFPADVLAIGADARRNVGVRDSTVSGDANAMNRPDGMVCGSVTARAQGSKRPVDIVWAIDSSPSMDDEIATIEANLNIFAARIGGSSLDYRVVLIGSDRRLEGGVDIPEFHDHHAICVPPPLSGAPGCPDTDSDTYLHVREPIHSADALAVTVSSFRTWQPFLRPDARLHMIFVSDDDHRRPVSREELVMLGFPEDFYVHSIVNPMDYVDGCAAFGETDGIECGCGDDRGRAYIGLTESTGGLNLNLCQDDWSPIFDQLNERVESGSAIPCLFDIPEPVGAVIDFQRVNVDFVDGSGMRTPLYNTDDCAMNPTGWRFDDPAMPQRIVLCPDVCGDLDGEVEVEFGCDIRKR
jgi:hypothetical protein